MRRRGIFLSGRFQESNFVTNTASSVVAEFLFLESSRLEGRACSFLNWWLQTGFC